MLTLRGRTTRARYLAAVAAVLCLTLITGMVGGTVGQDPRWNALTIASYVVWAVVSALLLVSFGSRRLHDLDQSAWWQLLLLVPYINLALIIYLAAAPGSKGGNRFGEQPAA